ncbi:MAG: bifunctional heptose 7-phosphate kinase/heptose 1-phosphate adenyltransferase [Candidatus Woesearchaeota archaeon]
MKTKDVDFENFHVLVIGEAMLDEYIYGDTSRISPEAPVPVVKYQKTTYNLGGSANIAQNIANLGAKVEIFTFVGDDVNKDKLISISKDKNIGIIPVILSRPTIVKTRIMARNQQILRIDYEDDADLFGMEEKEVIKKITAITKKYDAVILSDYNKGIFTKNICDAIFTHFKGVFILADTKPKKMDLFKKATLIKSNFSEFKEFLRIRNISVDNTDEDIENVRKTILDNFNSYLLTRSEKGISYISKEKIEHIPTNAKSVFDVTGAGDTVTATFILEYLRTKNIELSMRFANIAAGIVISKYGCIPITKKDLFLEEQKEERKIISDYNELKQVAENLKKQGKKLVFTNGCFDILHSGHTKYLKKAKSLGDVLFLALNDDASVKRYKGKDRPIIDENSRLTLMSALESVDYVFLFHEDNPTKVISIVKPDFHVKGSDYTENIPEADEVKKHGGKLVFINLEKQEEGSKVSTSQIIEKIVKVYGGNNGKK